MISKATAIQYNSVLDRLRPLRHSKLGTVISLALVLIALVSTQLAEHLWQSSALLVFAAAIAVSTILFGIVAGLITAFVSTLTVDFFYIPPVFAFNLDRSFLWVALEYALLSALVHLSVRQISARVRSNAKLGVFGQLDGIVEGEAYGWAFDADNPTSPVRVLVCVDQRPVAETAAVYYRPDVAASMNCSGRHGFYVDLSEYTSTEKETVVEVRFSEPKLLANCPVQARFRPRAERRPPTVLFMHIPRTAGTAFRDAITCNYKQAEIAYLYPDPPGFLVEDLSLLPLPQRRGFHLVIGHFRYGVHAWLPQESVYATIVRHPLSRVISQYLFLGHTQPDRVTENGLRLQLEEALELKNSVDFDNAMVRYFGGIDDKEVPPGMVNRGAYELAVHHLHTRFSYVGHQEAAQESYRALRERFNWIAKRELEPLNLATEAVSLMHDENLRKVVEYYNPWDYLLYEEVLRLFPIHNCKSPGALRAHC